MRRCRLFAPVFATLVVSLFLFNVGAAQEDPIAPPGDVLAPPTQDSQVDESAADAVLGQPHELAPLPDEPEPIARLTLELQVEAVTVSVNDPVDITVMAANSGAATLSNFSVCVYLPPGLAFATALAEGMAFDSQSRLVSVAPAPLLPGQSVALPFRVVVENGVPAELLLTAAGGASHLLETAQAELALTVAGGETLDGGETTIQSTLSGNEETGGWALRTNEPVVSAFSGAAVFDYPIPLPPGRNGLQPNVGLSYNSKRVDGIINWQASEWVGLGWNVDEIDIVRSRVRAVWPGNPEFWLTYDNRFHLTLNGTSYLLQPADASQNHGRYYADGAPELNILRINDCSDDDDCNNNSGGSQVNKTTEYWLVQTTDGTTYRLGYEAQSEQVIWRTRNGESDAASPYSGPIPNHTAYRWRVDQVADVYGNEMRYEYLECRTGSAACSYYTSGPDGAREVASYLHKIYYNQQDSVWLTTVEFVGTTSGNSQSSGPPVFHTRRELNSIRVSWGSSLVQEHALSYDRYYVANSGLVLLLKEIKPYGLGGAAAGNPLPGPTFGYQRFDNKGRCHESWGTQCNTNSPEHQWNREGFPYERLAWIENGYGGRTEFSYDHDGRDAWWGPYFNYRVSQKRIFDGVSNAAGPVRREEYQYGVPCYDQWNDGYGALCTWLDNPDMSEYEYGPLVGHGWTRITLSGQAGTERVSEHHFHTNHGTPGYALRGRERQSDIFAADGTTLLTRTEHDYGVNDAVCATNGLQGMAIFTCLKETRQRQYHPDGSANQLRRITYLYEPGRQSGVQYGQLTRATEFDENGVVQHIKVVVHIVNTANWVIVPRMDAVFDGGWNLNAATLLLYDGQTDPDDQVITIGRLTWQRRLRPVIPVNGCAGSGGPFDTVDTTFTYDSNYPGNLQTTTTYAGYGHIACASDNWDNGSVPGNGSSARPITTTYDSNGLFPVSVQNPLGHTVSTAYDASFPWLPASVTDPNGAINGAVTHYGYDRYGRLRGVARPDDNLDNATVRYTYWDDPTVAGGTLFLSPLLIETSYKDALQQNVRRFYNGLGQLVQEQYVRSDIANVGQRDVLATTAYNAQGLVACQTAPYHVTPYVWTGSSPFRNDNCYNYARTTSSYDALGRVTVVTDPVGGRSEHRYGVEGGLVYHDVLDPNRQRIQYRYDALGRLARVYEIEGNCGAYWGYTCGGAYTAPWAIYAVTTYSYDALNNLTEVRDNAGNQTTMSYDALGRKTAMTDPDMGPWSYTYDPAGNLSEQHDARGQTLTFTYDALNRVKTKKHGTTTLASYTYDQGTNGKGRLTRVDDPTGWHTWSHDARGRVTEEEKHILGGGTYKVRYTYDALDRVRSVTYPNQETVTANYNHQGLPRSLVGTNSYVTEAGYNFMGQLKHLRLGNGLTTWYGYHGYEPFGLRDAYDARNQSWNWPGLPFGNLWRTCTAPNGSTICQAANKDQPVNGQLLDLRHSYDPGGNVKAVRDYTNANQVQYFEYDTLNRLTAAYTVKEGSGTAQGPYNHHYTYNQIGNITGYDGTSYQYSETSWDSRCTFWPSPNPPSQSMPHAVRKIGSHYFCYDNNGNMTQRSDSTGLYTQAFDVENRLVSVTKNDAGTTTFAYDAAGQRVKTVKPDGTIVYTPFPGYEEEVRALPAVDLKANGADSLQLPSPAAYTLSWSTDHATSCTLTRNGATLMTTNGNGSYNESNMGVGTYTYVVTCSNLSGETATDSVPVIVTAGAPPAPTDLKAKYVSARHGVALSWSYAGPTDGVTFSVYRSSTLPIPLDSAHRIASNLSSSGPFAGVYQDRAGQLGDYYVVTAVNNLGETASYPAKATEDGGIVLSIGEEPLAMVIGGTVTIQRITYTIAGQAVAIRVSGDPKPANNGLFYIHSDHLGSTSLLSTSSGALVSGSTARYLPFGAWRTTPTQTLTDRGYTGHRHNNELGLIYMNARYYVPYINRFLSADSIVPDPADPQSFNRYTYALNNPLKYVDPTGHCAEPLTFVLCTAAIGAGIGLIVDYGVQVYGNIIDNGMVWWDAVYYPNINWVEAGGSAAAGGVGAGVAAPIASLAGPSLISTLAWSGFGGMTGGVVGGQVGALVKGSLAEAGDALSGYGFNGDELLQSAAASGFLDPNAILLDGATGTLFAWAGEGLSSAFHAFNPLAQWRGSSPIPMIGYQPQLGGGVRPMISYSGRTVVLEMSQYEQIITALSQGAIDVVTNLLTELFGTVIPDELN